MVLDSRFRTRQASVPRNFAQDVAREMLTAFVRGVASNLKDQPAVGEKFVASEHGWS
jgi:hypothetical protein